MSEIRHQARGLVNVPKIGLHVISSGIVLKELGIAPNDQMSCESQHADKQGDMLKEKMIRLRFRRNVGTSDDMPEE